MDLTNWKMNVYPIYCVKYISRFPTNPLMSVGRHLKYCVCMTTLVKHGDYCSHYASHTHTHTVAITGTLGTDDKEKQTP